jgi:hypothetical protein
VLFVDGSEAVATEDYMNMLRYVERGAHLVLIDRTPYHGIARHWHYNIFMDTFLNTTMGKPELAMNSVSQLPHVWSRAALTLIGSKNLAVPALAHARALMAGLRIMVYPLQTKRPQLASPSSNLQMAGGDYLEAVGHITAQHGSRGRYPDASRHRHILESVVAKYQLKPLQVSAIIGAREEEEEPEESVTTTNATTNDSENVEVNTSGNGNRNPSANASVSSANTSRNAIVSSANSSRNPSTNAGINGNVSVSATSSNSPQYLAVSSKPAHLFRKMKSVIHQAFQLIKSADEEEGKQ